MSTDVVEVSAEPPAQPPLPAFGPQWPGAGRSALSDVLLVTAVTAVLAAALLSWDRPGVGWLVTGVVGCVGVVVVCVRGASGGRPVTRLIWAALALLLLTAGALRAAVWLWALCLPTATVCAALGLVGARTLGAHVLSVLSFPIAVFRALPWGVRGFAGVRGRTSSSVIRIIAAVVVSLVLLLVFGALLAGADKVFATLVDRFLPTVDAGVVTRWVLTFLLVSLATLGACFMALKPPVFESGAAPKPRRGLGRIEWGLPVGTLVMLFGAFVAVEATVLFGGGDHVLATAGLTYAEYARQGFWQLLAVTVLTLVVLGVAARVARRESVADQMWLRALLGLLAVLTLVIVVSAVSRMWAYEQVYGFSRLRLLVSVCEGWLGLLFVLVIVAGIRLRGGWLVRATAMSAAAALVGIIALNPDEFIAERNIARYETSHTIDLAYLSELSADAVPALVTLPPDMRRCVLAPIAEDLRGSEPDEWREWNLGRSQARALLVDERPLSDAEQQQCWDRLYTRP